MDTSPISIPLLTRPRHRSQSPRPGRAAFITPITEPRKRRAGQPRAGGWARASACASSSMVVDDLDPGWTGVPLGPYEADPPLIAFRACSR